MISDIIEISDAIKRREALDPSRSFIVQAPAGSGKTGLLIQRILSLLSAVVRPEAVVAMTFTRKAAAEIRERVIEALESAGSNEAPKSEYEFTTRELARAALQKHPDLLSDPMRLQVQTIDASCAMLSRQMPIISQFGGFAEVIENPTDLYHLAARRALSGLAERDETAGIFQRVSLHFDNNIPRLEAQMVKMLARRDQWDGVDPSSERDELVRAFEELLCLAEKNLQEVFREHGQVDFVEVSRAATRALGRAEEPTDLLYALDYRIEHLLVDEFQDTSRTQYRLLHALTEQWSEGDGHTLFLVGDPVQSIYGFREADVSLFLQCWQDKRLGSVALTPLQLTTNFRSTPEIVDWTQDAFTPIMSKDDQREGAVRLTTSQASRSATRVHPEVIALIGDDGQKEARLVVKLAQQALTVGSVAILVRGRTHLTQILPALQDAAVPYEAIDIDALKEEQHVLDLISLTRAVLHVGDRLSWIACLRAPWCGLTLADLSALAEDEPNRTILDLLSDPERIARLSPDGRNRAVRVQEILSNAVQNAGRYRLRDVVERAWLTLGGPAVLEQEWQLKDIEAVLELMEQFDTGGVIRDFSLIEERLECLYAKSAKGENLVRVLTIHGAKGLEFDTVIIPHLGTGSPSSDGELLIWSENQIAAQPQKGDKDPRYQRVRDYLKAKERHERTRVFYVGVTRAKNQLFLIGNAKLKKDGSGFEKPRSDTFAGMIWDIFAPRFEQEFRQRKLEQQNLEFDNQKSIIRRLPAEWRSPRLDQSVNWQPAFRTAVASARKVSYEWVSDTARHIGTVVHDILQRVASEGVEAWPVERVNCLAPMITSELVRLGVSRSNEPEASLDVLRAIRNTLSSERGRWVLRAHAEARSEWPVGGRVKNQLTIGTVDRVFRDEEGRLWIVDFKTSEHKGGRLQAFLDEEQRRYREQLDNYATIISRLANGPICLGLYFPLLDEWREWRFEEEVGMPSHYTGL